MNGAAPSRFPRGAAAGAYGQAGTEYLVVLLFCALVLVAAALAPAPVQALLDAIRGFFAAYSFALSLAS